MKLESHAWSFDPGKKPRAQKQHEWVKIESLEINFLQILTVECDE